MARVCFGCGLSTNSSGALQADCRVVGEVAVVRARTEGTEMGRDTTLWTSEELCYTNNTDCDQRIVMTTSAEVQANNCPPCGNPLYRFEFSEDGGDTFQTLADEPPQAICGWGDGATDTNFPFAMHWGGMRTLVPGEELCRIFRLRALSWDAPCYSGEDPLETPVATLALGRAAYVRVC